MSLLYTYGTGSTTESKRWSMLDDLLNQIPNNNTNLILAKDVRDAIFTLWERLNETATASNVYQNTNVTPITIGGIPAGSSFSTPYTMQQMFDMLLYPYLSPTLSLGSLNNKEYGSALLTTLNWSVVKKSNPITGITVDGQSFTPTGDSQTGTKNISGTYSTPEPASTINTFTMSVTDGTSTNTTNVSFTWSNRIYWGTINLSALGNPDFGTNPGSASMVTLNSAMVVALDGASVSPGNQLSATKSKTYNSINGAGKYLIFAWPSSVSNATSPIFTVNGLLSTAFTRIKTNWNFTNTFGFITPYEVWITNTQQNSPLNIIVS